MGDVAAGDGGADAAGGQATGGVMICCGPKKGVRKAFRCGCCGFETDDIEAMAMSTCWACSGIGGGNLDCENCRDMGVWVDRFSTKRSKGHRMLRWEKGKRAVLTACGVRIPTKDLGQGCAVRTECRRCWPEEPAPSDEGRDR